MESERNEEQEGQGKDEGAIKTRSNSDTHQNSIHSGRRKSGSFLSKLQSSIDEKDGSTMPSSFASAFSSFTSLTSNFTLNTSTNSNNQASSLTIETASTSTRSSNITELKESLFQKRAATERKNLINLTKLIVKDLISSSLLSQRTIDDCQNAVHLNNYFTLIDRVLKHGLKQNLLSNKSANLWSALDSLPKYLNESTLMSESIRSLANTKSPDGKIKAWMRLAMMQKRLPEYFNELIANKSILLKDIYYDYAFMLNDEAQVFAGLIIGVNVIDCNFFVKDANFDLMDDIIDLSPYLKAANIYDDQNDSIQEEVAKDSDSMTAVLDQKNYLEEWNKRLESSVSDLQAKIKSLEEENSNLEMEAKLSEARIIKLQEKYGDTLLDVRPSIASAIKSLLSSNSDSKSPESSELGASSKQDAVPEQDIDEEKTNSTIEIDKLEQKTESGPASQITEVASVSGQSDRDSQVSSSNLELRARLVEQEKELNALKERASILEASYRSALEKIKVLERDLDIQTSMNADRETTIKIYEKDIKEKQSQVDSTRTSLNDAKKLNTQLTERLNETDAKMKDRVKTISHLQDSLVKWKLENKTLATRFEDKSTALKSVTNDLEKALKTIAELKKYNEKINDELRTERESGQSSSVTVEAQNAQISELTEKLEQLEAELKDVKPFKDQTEGLSKKCRDYELSLEEMGAQLREAKLELENLKENSAVFLDSQWLDSRQIKTCALCQLSFSVTRRKHHCRLCGNVFCQTCSDNKMELASSSKPVRVCDTCHEFLLAKFVKNSISS